MRRADRQAGRKAGQVRSEVCLLDCVDDPGGRGQGGLGHRYIGIILKYYL